MPINSKNRADLTALIINFNNEIKPLYDWMLNMDAIRLESISKEIDKMQDKALDMMHEWCKLETFLMNNSFDKGK